MPNNELWYVMRIKLIVMWLSEEEDAQEDMQSMNDHMSYWWL